MRTARPALLALAAGGFAIGTTEFASMGLVPQISADFGASVPATGWIITAYALGVVVGAPLLTVVGSRIERKKMLLILMALFVLGHIFSVVAGNLNILILARFLAALPHGAFFGAGAVVGAAIAGPGNRAKAIGAMMAGLTLANMLGVPFSTRIGQLLGWRAMFVVVGVLGLITLVAIWRMVPAHAVAPGRSARSELRTLRNGPLWIGLIGGGIGFGGLFAVYTYVAPLVMEVGGMGEATVPLIMGLFGLGMTVGVVIGGRMADHGVMRTVFISMAATIATLVLLGLTGTNSIALVACLFGLGVVSQIVGIALQARLMDLSPLAPALGAALSHAALNLGNAEGAFFGGLVIDAGWGYLGTAWIGAILTATGLIVLVVFGRTQTQEDVATRVRASLARPAAPAGADAGAEAGAAVAERDGPRGCNVPDETGSTRTVTSSEGTEQA